MSLFFRAIFVTSEVRVSVNAYTKRSKKWKYVEGPASNVKAYSKGMLHEIIIEMHERDLLLYGLEWRLDFSFIIYKNRIKFKFFYKSNI